MGIELGARCGSLPLYFALVGVAFAILTTVSVNPLEAGLCGLAVTCAKSHALAKSAKTGIAYLHS